jgi:hypothetical protein
MLIDRILKMVTTETPDPEGRELASLLKEAGFSEEVVEELRGKAQKLRSFLKNPATVEAFFRSYLRTYGMGNRRDGRDSSAIIEITKRCEKSCPHCYARVGADAVSMDDQVLAQVMEFLRTNYKHIFFTGGNPVLDGRVLELAQLHPDIVFFMFNNGSGIDSTYAARLAELGNLIPMLSVEGSTRERHDDIRGEGSFLEVSEAMDNLNAAGATWGYISLVAQTNAQDVLSPDFVRTMRSRGAVMGRYIEYLPVGPNPIPELILSGEGYFLLESRKKEIIAGGEIYLQDTAQAKCGGLLFFDVEGNIKNCPFMHFARHQVKGGSLATKVAQTIQDWSMADYEGECPIYSDPMGFRDHLVSMGWRHVSAFSDEYLVNGDLADAMREKYRAYLALSRE